MSNIYNVDAATLRTWLASGSAVIIDVREPVEYEQGYIKGAINIPLASVIDQIQQIKDLSVKKIVMQCRAGVRSLKACQMLHNAGFEHDLWNLEDGILAWQEH